MSEILLGTTMRDNNRTLRDSFFLICSFCLVFLCFACENEEAELERQKLNKERASKLIKYYSKPDQEIVALLALK